MNNYIVLHKGKWAKLKLQKHHVTFSCYRFPTVCAQARVYARTYLLLSPIEKCTHRVEQAIVSKLIYMLKS